MRKTLMSAAVAAALVAGGSAFATPLTFSLDGGNANVITAQSLDWAQTSFLAKNGTLAIDNFAKNLQDGGARDTKFDVLTHAKLTGYVDQNGVSRSGLGSFTGEITIVSRFTETVTSLGSDFARFRTTGAGWVEMYYSAAQNSDNLRGANFNDGRVIMQSNGVGFTNGDFSIDDDTAVDLDQFGGQDYFGQKTVSGHGSQQSITFGKDGVVLDNNFLRTGIADFSLLFNNISIGLPYETVDPSDCFNLSRQAAIGDPLVTANSSAPWVSQCGAFVSALNPHHVNGTYAQNAGGPDGQDGGYVPVVGPVNGLFNNSTDFVAQTDFNSRVTGTPEPGILALLGLAFAGLGLSRRRRSA